MTPGAPARSPDSPAGEASPSAAAGGGAVRQLRERLLAARQAGDRAAAPALVDGLRDLARRGYRCCLADFGACQPAFYVRLIGFDGARVTAQLEFPIDPSLQPVQRLPLSHLVDYDEATPEAIGGIYRRLAPYLRRRRAPLQPASPAVRVSAGERGVRRARRQRPASMAAWWAAAAVLLVSSLVVFAVA